MLGDSKLLKLDCFSLSFALLMLSIACTFRCFNLWLSSWQQSGIVTVMNINLFVHTNFLYSLGGSFPIGNSTLQKINKN